jgi:hypothetical protein
MEQFWHYTRPRGYKYLKSRHATARNGPFFVFYEEIVTNFGWVSFPHLISFSDQKISQEK